MDIDIPCLKAPSKLPGKIKHIAHNRYIDCLLSVILAIPLLINANSMENKKI